VPSLSSLHAPAPTAPPPGAPFAPPPPAAGQPFAPQPPAAGQPYAPQPYAPQSFNAPTAPNQYVAESRPVTVPTLGALIPLAALLALVGAVTPWFAPVGTVNDVRVLQAEHALYSWKDGRLGLIAPIALTILGIGVIALMRGRTSGRFRRSDSPLSSAGNRALWVSLISAGGLGASWEFVTHQYRPPVDNGGSWDGAQQMGIAMSRNPQVGFYLTAAAVVLALVGGIALKSAGRRSR
jgi:hypothetical protein